MIISYVYLLPSSLSSSHFHFIILFRSPFFIYLIFGRVGLVNNLYRIADEDLSVSFLHRGSYKPQVFYVCPIWSLHVKKIDFFPFSLFCYSLEETKDFLLRQSVSFSINSYSTQSLEGTRLDTNVSVYPPSHRTNPTWDFPTLEAKDVR